MAEQEACTELVERASQDQVGTTIEGESQLLPLLQGLLEAPDNEQLADSGTESGEDQRSGLIAEVQNALDKLSMNLRDDAADITPERRSSLLQLVTKLQAGLAASVPTNERRSSVQSRFRRRQRPNRHTVGVSSEELADARRLIEEISLRDLTPTTLQKQHSESSVGRNIKGFKLFAPEKAVVTNAVAKPFSSSNSTVSGNSSSVQTPTDSLDFLNDIDRKSDTMSGNRVRKSSSGEVSVKSVQQVVQEAAARKTAENLVESEETDEETVKPHPENPIPDVVMQNNPLYLQEKEEKENRFVARKLKMKRANTIDIPKPLNFYEEHEDSDCSLPEDDYYQRRRGLYLALRGPVRVSNTNIKNTVPVFEPKTDNDKKFLAFINKHNENTSGALWAKPGISSKCNIWSNKFDNIKTTFEKGSTARQFWKRAEAAPKVSRESTQNVKRMFEDKQKIQPNEKNIVTGSLKVKAFEPYNDKTHKFLPQPLPVNKFSHAPQSAFKPLSKKVLPNLEISNVFKQNDKDNGLDSPMFLYKPRPASESSLKPWVASPSESRVLSLAASKFGNNSAPPAPPLIKPRKLSTDRVSIPSQPMSPESLDSPTFIKNHEQMINRNVRQLSGQHNGRSVDNNYSTFTTVKYISPQIEHKRIENDCKRQEYNEKKNYFHPLDQTETSSQGQFYNPRSSQQHQCSGLSNQPFIKEKNKKDSDFNSSKQQFREPEYTSTYQYSPQVQTTLSRVEPKKLESQVSVESATEYGAVSSKVMTGPVCQQATTVRQKSPMNRDEHEIAAAMNLRNSLQKVNTKPVPKIESSSILGGKSDVPKTIGCKTADASGTTGVSSKSFGHISPNSFSYKPRRELPKQVSPHSFTYKNNSYGSEKRATPIESLEFTKEGESVVTSKFQIPVIHLPESSRTPTLQDKTLKAKSWNEICMQTQQPFHKPSPRSSPNARTVTKSKSSHSLSVPKQFEAGMTKDEMVHKRKTMEAFFAGGNKSRTSSNENLAIETQTKVVKRSINRLKTCEKNAAYRQSSGLSRSRTLPDIVCPDMLDENNVDKAFDDLFSSSK